MNIENASVGPSDDIEATLGLNTKQDRRKRRRWAIVVLALALLVIAGGWGLLNQTDDPRFQTVTVQRGALTVTVTATGKLEPVNQVDVGSELSGTIERVEVDFNDRVEKGQVLARLDTEQLEARVVQARASLKAAQASLREAQATAQETAARLKRQQSLLKQNLTSREQLDTAQAAHSRARAAVESAEAQVKLAEASLEADLTNLKKAVIVSPIDGIVLSRQIEPGQTVAASFQTPVLFQLAEDLKQMELHVDVDEADVGQVEPGQPARFTVDAYPQRTFNAEITSVHYAPKITQDVVTYESRLRVDNSDLLLRPGMTATADIIVKELKDVLRVPNAALRFDPPPSVRGETGTDAVSRQRIDTSEAARNENTVWVMVEGAVKPLSIKTGATDGRYTAVLGGELSAGMQVITDVIAEQDSAR